MYNEMESDEETDQPKDQKEEKEEKEEKEVEKIELEIKEEPHVVGFPVDSIFSEPLDREDLIEPRKISLGQLFPSNTLLPSVNSASYQSYDSGSIYTFEEFINRASPVSDRKPEMNELKEEADPPNLPNIDADEDGFYNVALGPKVREELLQK